jgi:hypothetical protein
MRAKVLISRGACLRREMRPKLDRSNRLIFEPVADHNLWAGAPGGNVWLPPLRLSLSESQKCPQFVRKVSVLVRELSSLARVAFEMRPYHRTVDDALESQPIRRWRPASLSSEFPMMGWEFSPAVRPPLVVGGFTGKS